MINNFVYKIHCWWEKGMLNPPQTVCATGVIWDPDKAAGDDRIWLITSLHCIPRVVIIVSVNWFYSIRKRVGSELDIAVHSSTTFPQTFYYKLFNIGTVDSIPKLPVPNDIGGFQVLWARETRNYDLFDQFRRSAKNFKRILVSEKSFIHWGWRIS